METEVRGFSFMPNTKMEVMDMQYIESEELERTWKTSRRQRLQQQEQKIWDEFVKEQDVLSDVCKGGAEIVEYYPGDKAVLVLNDPYQFLEQLPESCLKELMEIELNRMKTESSVEQPDDVGPIVKVLQFACLNKHTKIVLVILTSDDSREEDVVGGGEDLHQSEVENDPEPEPDCHIFVFETEEGDSDGEDEVPPSSAMASPDTVRERSPERPSTPDRVSDKSSEDMPSAIENSVHSAKIKDLRTKINEEILAIVTTLDKKDISGIEPEELTKMCRRSAEFCTRFNRIHLYQLQRQIQDVKRNCDASLPFARHTQLQSQMVRIVSLHQNLLQALQALHKSAGSGSSACGAESAAAARAAAAAAAAATDAARRAHPAAAIYDDDLLVSCEKLEEAFSKHEAIISDYLNSSVKNTNSSRSHRSSNVGSKKSTITTWSKTGYKMRSDAQSRLSMYSLDTLRSHSHPKTSHSRNNQARSRRPLMRGDSGGRARARPRDARVRTLVECTSSRVSCDTTPCLQVTPSTTPRRCNKTPRSGDKTIQNSEKSPRRCDESPQLDKTQYKRRDEKSPGCDDTKKLDEPLVDGSAQRVKMMGQNAKIRGEYPSSSVGRPSPCTRGKINPKTTLPTTPPINPNTTPRNAKVNDNCGTPKGVSTTAPNSKDRDRTEPGASANQKPPEHNKTKVPEPGGCEVTRIVRELCGGDAVGLKNERVSGAKNAQLYCVSGSSPRQPSTPQLLKILEESIQKKTPMPPAGDRRRAKDAEQLRLPLGVPAAAADSLRRRRAGFLQHMLTSPLYANSELPKPWEAVERVSEQLIDGLLLQCAQEMQLDEAVRELYDTETC